MDKTMARKVASPEWNGHKRTPEFLVILRNIVRRGSGKVGAILFILIVLISIFAPLIAPYDPMALDMKNAHQAPSSLHIFGTDAIGRDIFSRVLYGGRYSLVLGLSGALLSFLFGIVLGSIAGFYGGKIESFIMRAMDVLSALPGMLLCILISAAFGSGFFVTAFALCVGHIPGNTRMIRVQVVSARSKEYIEAAQAIDSPDAVIMFRHILPNAVSPLIVTTTMSIGSTINAAAALSLIGLGIRPPTPEWGALLADAKGHYLAYPYMIVPPGVAIALTVLALNLLGDGLRDALDPKLRD